MCTEVPPVPVQCPLTLTLLPPQCKEGGFPQELWLGVSADAVSVYKRGEGKPLEVFQYEHILSFGAPLANTYKIVVDERELLFETSEVRGRGADGTAGVSPSQGRRTAPPPGRHCPGFSIGPLRVSFGAQYGGPSLS